MERKQVRLGLIGYGDIGSGIGGGLRKEGLESIAAYDIASFDGKFSQLIQRRASEGRTVLARTPAELAERADYIITAVPGLDCVPAATAIAPYLTERHHYIDISSATPSVKKNVAAALAASGAQVADGGIEGTALGDGYRISILASGPAAQAFTDLLNPWNMRLKVVGSEVGTGSAIKILRSVIFKGLECLFIECGMAAAKYGLQEEVFESALATVEAQGIRGLHNSSITTVTVHAERRFHELEMSAQALEEVGVEPVMTRSTVRRLNQIAQMGLKEFFNAIPPKDYRTALKEIAKRMPALEAAGV